MSHLRVLLAKELSLGELCNGDGDDLNNPVGCVLLKFTVPVVIIEQESIAEEEWSYCQ